MTHDKSYTSPEELRQEVSITLTTNDVSLKRLIDAASRMIDRYCKVPDGFIADATASARTFTGRGLPFIRVDQFVAVTAVGVKDSPSDTSYTAWLTGDWLPFAGSPQRPSWNPLSEFQPRPYDGIMVAPNGSYSVFSSGQYRGGWGFSDDGQSPFAAPTVQVTAKWGYSVAVPDIVAQACRVQVAQWLKRAASGWADAVANAEFQTLMFTKSLDPAVKLLLDESGIRQMEVI